jgi:C4-dicarboxylate transporter DctM subunit
LGATGAFLLGIATRRLKVRNFKEAIMESTKTTASILLILAMAHIFGYFLGISRIPAAMSDFMLGLQVHRLVVFAGVMILFIIAGMFMDMLTFCFLTLPIIYPGMLALGFDPLWFGIIIVILCELALITPPFGLNLFVLKGMMPDVKMADVIRGSVPFAVMYVVVVALCTAFPQLITWLPSLM